NCHTATDYPQQGDDRHRHFANVVRGREGRGVAALSCIGCHQEVNADSTGVPGGPDWHLAPLSMQWQDLNDRPLSSAAVCRAVTDRSKNENMSGPELLTHHEKAELVLWAWNPGRRPDGTFRTTPPLSHQEFVAATRTWVEKDVVQCGYCQSGQIMSAVALLKETPKPTETNIEESMGGNLCRCATYVRIREAIKSAAQQLG